MIYSSADKFDRALTLLMTLICPTAFALNRGRPFAEVWIYIDEETYDFNSMGNVNDEAVVRLHEGLTTKPIKKVKGWLLCWCNV